MIPLAFIQNLGIPELLIILVIALLLFGHRLPGVGRAMGKSVNEFKEGFKDGKDKDDPSNNKEESEAVPSSKDSGVDQSLHFRLSSL